MMAPPTCEMAWKGAFSVGSKKGKEIQELCIGGSSKCLLLNPFPSLSGY